MKGRILEQRIVILALLATSLLGASTHAQQRPGLAEAPRSAAQDDPNTRERVAAELFLRTELFFGTEKPDGSEISKEDFRRFLKEEITPRFPDGLTVLTGTGQFRDAESDRVIREKSIVLILLYPLNAAKEGNEKIEQIRKAYKERLKQQSVLRVDDPRPVLVSF
jgi:hypothetical protein